MKYLQAAIDLGYPADCATNGNSYEDLLRTWNKAYATVPKLNPLQARIDEVAGQIATGQFSRGELQNTADSALRSLTKKPEIKKRKRFFGLF